MRCGLFLIFRMVAAIRVWPACRIRPMTRLRRVAMMRGLESVLILEKSSRKVTLMATSDIRTLWMPLRGLSVGIENRYVSNLSAIQALCSCNLPRGDSCVRRDQIKEAAGQQA
jgi:hypothetical protein